MTLRLSNRLDIRVSANFIREMEEYRKRDPSFNASKIARRAIAEKINFAETWERAEMRGEGEIENEHTTNFATRSDKAREVSYGQAQPTMAQDQARNE